jgi:putative transposase
MTGMQDHDADEIRDLLARGRRLRRAGHTLDEVLDELGLDELTWYRYQAEYGALAHEQLRRLRKLEAENQRLRLSVSRLMLDKLALEEAAWLASGVHSAA